MAPAASSAAGPRAPSPIAQLSAGPATAAAKAYSAGSDVGATSQPFMPPPLPKMGHDGVATSSSSGAEAPPLAPSTSTSPATPGSSAVDNAPEQSAAVMATAAAGPESAVLAPPHPNSAATASSLTPASGLLSGTTTVPPLQPSSSFSSVAAPFHPVSGGRTKCGRRLVDDDGEEFEDDRPPTYLYAAHRPAKAGTAPTASVRLAPWWFWAMLGLNLVDRDTAEGRGSIAGHAHTGQWLACSDSGWSCPYPPTPRPPWMGLHPQHRRVV